VVVGDILGEGLTERAAVVGQAPNFAARLQELAAPNAIVIALATRQLAAERFEYLDLGEHTLKGFEHATDVFQVLRERPANRLEARGSLLTSLFGRERELTRLLSLWAKCENSEGQVVFVCGSAGLGKSRLAAAVRERVASSQAAIRRACSRFSASHFMSTPSFTRLSGSWRAWRGSSWPIPASSSFPS
jgi:hypothetical protein